MCKPRALPVIDHVLMQTLNVDDEPVHGQKPERVHGVHDELVSAPHSESKAASGQLLWGRKFIAYMILVQGYTSPGEPGLG